MSVSDEKIPVFEHPPCGVTTLDDCIGWVSDAALACDLLLTNCETVRNGFETPGIGKSVFGGVMKGHIRIPTEDGPYRDAKGLYRWQSCFSPFFDSVENAGKQTQLDKIFIYNRSGRN